MDDFDATAPTGDHPTPHKDRLQPLEPKTALRFGVLVYVIENLAFGIPMMLWPTLMWETIAGAEGVALDALVSNRWVGGVLTALGIGGILVFLRPKGQQTFVTTMALQLSLAGAAIIVSLLTGEFDMVDAWFPWASAIIVSLAGIYLWSARFRARHVLAG